MSRAKARLRLWQLISPALPVGAYAYSRGLEYAVSAGWVCNDFDAAEWIEGQLTHLFESLEVPVFARLYRAWQDGDEGALAYWNSFLLAARESAELLAEDQYLGDALARLLTDLGIEDAGAWRIAKRPSFATLFALGAERWDIELPEAAEGYTWVWGEHQIAAAVKLIPLGQTAGQRILSRLAEVIPEVVRFGLALADDAIGGVAPGVAIASALHEGQHTRLFRS
ncbi:MAG: urease accessory protein UreF [Gammaproteobacteria bacterium]